MQDESAGEDGELDDEERGDSGSDRGVEDFQKGLGEQGGKHHGSGEIPVRMYRSVVLTSVRQFTDPEAQTSEQVCEEAPMDEEDLEDESEDAAMEDGDAPKADGAEERFENVDLEQSEATTELRPFETFGYFNAAFEDFEEQEKEVEQVTARIRPIRRMEVVRGEMDQFNEEDEEEMETSSVGSQSLSSDSSSSEVSESDSVKYVALNNNASSSVQALNEPYTVEVCSSQLPSPEKPSMEVLDSSRPMTPEEFPLELEHKDAAPFASPEDSEVEDTPRSVAEPTDEDERRLAMEHDVMERLRVEEARFSSQERAESPAHASTPPPTPAAHGELTTFQHLLPPLDSTVTIGNALPQDKMDDAALEKGEKQETNQAVETCEQSSAIQAESNSLQGDSDNQAFQNETELDRSGADQAAIPDENQSSPPALPEPSSSQLETDAESGSNQLMENEPAAEETAEEASVKNEDTDIGATEERLVIASVKPSRKVSRDEGTQTEFCSLTGRLHATKPVHQEDELVSITEPQYSVALQVNSAGQLVTTEEDNKGAEEVLSPEPLEQPEFDRIGETSEEIADKPIEAMEVAGEIPPEAESKPVLSSQVSDGEVFIDQAQPIAENEANEDDDSFYGSDKEVDGEIEFSQTESARSSSSSSSDSDVVQVLS